MSSTTSSTIETLYAEKFSQSASRYQQADKLFPSGVTHDARYLKPFPVYVSEAHGSKKQTIDGHELIDFWSGHGAMLLGHSHPDVVAAVQKQAALATHPSACHELEIEWGELVRQLKPSCEMVRFTNSGTEATLMALRLARIVTGRNKVLKFAGHFHGWHDFLMPAGAPPHDDPSYAMPGVVEGTMEDLLIVPPNDIKALEAAIAQHQPACVIHEGNGSRWGTVPTSVEYLQQLREVTKRAGVLLILDEVITGFRVSPGGFQSIAGITPDMTTMAKVLAGGLPGGCLGGKAEIMQALTFDNALGKKMKHPGTYNGNPLSAAAGIAALQHVATGEPSHHANKMAAQLREQLNTMFAKRHVPWVAYGHYSAVKIHPNYDGPRPTSDDFVPFKDDYKQLDCNFDSDLSHAFRCALLVSGVDWMGWGGSTMWAHTPDDITNAATAFENALELLTSDGFIQ